MNNYNITLNFYFKLLLNFRKNNYNESRNVFQFSKTEGFKQSFRNYMKTNERLLLF